MNKIFTTLLGIALLLTPIASEARPIRWHDGHGRIVAPLIIGGLIAGAIIDSTHQDPYVYTPLNTYNSFVVDRYYDRSNRVCEVRDTYDQYNNFVSRQTTCYSN